MKSCPFVCKGQILCHHKKLSECLIVDSPLSPAVSFSLFLPQKQGQSKMTLMSGGVKVLIQNNQNTPLGSSPRHPSRPMFAWHTGSKKIFPAFLVFQEPFFSLFFPSLQFSWTRLPCSCPLCHLQQHNISPKANGTKRPHIALLPSEPGQVKNDLVAQITSCMGHWPQSENLNSNTKRWKSRRRKIFHQDGALSAVFPWSLN